MKTVIQRVKSASVTVDGQLISSITKGLLVFAAIAKDDTPKEAESMAAKVLKAKFWDDGEGGKWKHNVQDIDGEILCVSQFTLLATMKKGNKPDFHKSAPAAKGKELYDIFIGQVRKLYREDMVKDGVFQAMMDVTLVNDGPVSPSETHPDATAPPSPTARTPTPSPQFESDSPFLQMPPIGVDFRCEDEVVTIEIDTNPPEMKNPTSLEPPNQEDTLKGHVHKTFELPASLLE